jgi:FeS assembly SUF system regulator
MIRISRMTDYGIALMTRIVQDWGEAGSFSSRDLAKDLGLPQPTVSKLLKSLTRADLLVSQRGANGGYELALPPEEISLTRLIDVLEGPIAMTVCSIDDAESSCDLESNCMLSGHWKWINRKIMEALGSVTLADIAGRPGTTGNTIESGDAELLRGQALREGR